jgi:lysozyme family protein
MEKLPNVNPITEVPRQSNFAFDGAIRRVLHHEGVYSNDPYDLGGPTKYGISLRAAKKFGDLDGDGLLDLDLDGDGDVDIHDIKQLDIQTAVDVYKRVYWDPHGYDYLAPSIAVKVFDLNVNMGARQAHLILQRAIRASSLSDAVKEDGAIGPLTVRSANRQQPLVMLAALRSEAAGFYRQLVITNKKSVKYINGWLTRAYS